jgi:glycosyltransferase involved in cell wall biosynthesis
MAAAVPGVAFSVGGVPDVITGPELGILVPAGDVDALAAALRTLLDDQSGREAMGRRARTFVRERFSIDRLLHDVDALYRELLAASHGSQR